MLEAEQSFSCKEKMPSFLAAYKFCDALSGILAYDFIGNDGK